MLHELHCSYSTKIVCSVCVMLYNYITYIRGDSFYQKKRLSKSNLKTSAMTINQKTLKMRLKNLLSSVVLHGERLIQANLPMS